MGDRDGLDNLARVLDASTRRWRLAPFYDLVNTTSYRGLSKSFAFRVSVSKRARTGCRERAGDARRARWRYVHLVGTVVREVAAMTDRIESALPTAIADVSASIGSDARLVQLSRAIAKGIRWVRRSTTA